MHGLFEYMTHYRAHVSLNCAFTVKGHSPPDRRAIEGLHPKSPRSQPKRQTLKKKEKKRKRRKMRKEKVQKESPVKELKQAGDRRKSGHKRSKSKFEESR
jgi:hypothetical protein